MKISITALAIMICFCQEPVLNLILINILWLGALNSGPRLTWDEAQTQKHSNTCDLHSQHPRPYLNSCPSEL